MSRFEDEQKRLHLIKQRRDTILTSLKMLFEARTNFSGDSKIEDVLRAEGVLAAWGLLGLREEPTSVITSFVATLIEREEINKSSQATLLLRPESAMRDAVRRTADRMNGLDARLESLADSIKIPPDARAVLGIVVREW